LIFLFSVPAWFPVRRFHLKPKLAQGLAQFLTELFRLLLLLKADYKTIGKTYEPGIACAASAANLLEPEIKDIV